MALADIVDVTVHINQATVAQQGFGVPLIFAHHGLPERVYTFQASTWARDMDAAGFPADHAAVRTAAAMMAQNPRPALFKVGRRSDPETQVVRIYPRAAEENAAYRVTVVSPVGVRTPVTHPTTTGATVAGIATALAAALALVPGVTAAATATYVTVTAAEPDRVFGFELSANLRLEDRSTMTGDGAQGEDLNAIEEQDSDWYALVPASSSPALVNVLRGWVETHRKIMVASTHDSLVFEQVAEGDTPTDLFYLIQQSGDVRTHLAYHSRADQFYGAAWTAAMLPYEPGVADWKFKTLSGVSSDRLTPTHEQRLLGKGGSYYEEPIRGTSITGAAKGGDGTFLDLTQLSDWLRARVTEGIVRMLTGTATKVPFTDQGGGNSIWGVLRTVALRAIDLGSVDEDPNTWSVYVPKKRDLPAPDVVARRWSGCQLNVTPTSSVHSVKPITININVTG